MKFEVVGSPVGKKRPKFSTIHGYAQAVKAKEDVIYENLVKVSFQQAKTVDYDLFNKPIKMKITAFFAVLKSFSKKKIEQALQGTIFPVTKPDVDNIAKIICDALNDVAYKDDTQIVELTIVKKYAMEPKVEITLEEYL
ncbi:MAG: RusA family crossover junction endodeoxyribonuclease [Clostridiales bacterium]|nr:RusA family crossover junction endodeoxyribonuclease [Clostridiales bacterium]